MHYCIKCKEETTWEILRERVFSNGTKHNEGACTKCRYTKLMPKEKLLEEHIFYFGKHKGKNITEVPLDYLKWGIEKDIFTGSMAWAAIKILEKNNIKTINYKGYVSPVSKQ